MKQRLLSATGFFSVVFVLLISVQIIAQDAKKASVQQQLIGNWYMGTMTGFDCDLKINSNNTLTVQFGGCFHRDPTITSEWTLQGDRIKLENASLNKSLGTYLQIVKYKGHLVLLPEHPQKERGKHKYSYHHSFWRNMAHKKLPKEAPE